MLSRFATLGGGGDPYWASVKFLLVGNGANGTNTNIIDSSSSPLTISNFGSTVISTAQSKFGSGSVAFNGTTQYLTVPSATLSFTGNFTIEGWFYLSNNPATGLFKTLWAQRASDAGFGGPAVAFDSTGKFYLYISNSSASGWDIIGFDTGMSTSIGSWQYIVLVKNGTSLTLYKNGSSTNIATSTSAIGASGATSIMTGSASGSVQNTDGYLYDFRITNGIARYTGSTMTVPTAPLPTYGP
jgi:hypothetical protein